MPYFVPDDDSWTEVSQRPDPPYAEVEAAQPKIQFVGSSASTFELTGAPARSDSETVHTVALLTPSLDDGLTLCALRADGQNLTVEDRRPPEARTRYADAFEQLQSALDEILIPVYIDDALDEMSESVEAIVAVHTAQYGAPPQSDCTYFRTAAFEAGSLLYEAERGAL